MSKSLPMMETLIRRRVPTVDDVAAFVVHAAMTPPDEQGQQRQLVNDETGLPIWVVEIAWRWVGEDGTPAPILGQGRFGRAFSIESETEPTMGMALARVVSDLADEWSMPGAAPINAVSLPKARATKRKARKRK